MDQLNSIVSTDPDDTTVSALIDASRALKETAPDLFDALHRAVPPMQVVAEQRAQLDSLISGGMNTLGTTQTALNNQTDRLVTITGNLTPVVGELANSSHNYKPGFVKLNDLSDRYFKEVFMPARDTANMRVNLSLTPSYSYTRADCPQYGALNGPSCFTAPRLVAVRPDIPEVLLPQNYQPPKNLAPPRGTVLGPNGNLVAVGTAPWSTRTPIWWTRTRRCRREWLPRHRCPAAPTPRLRRCRRRCRRCPHRPRSPVRDTRMGCCRCRHLRRRTERACPPRPPRHSGATWARSAAKRNASSSASPPASPPRLPPSCCSARWRAA